jgi:hypothetical protein
LFLLRDHEVLQRLAGRVHYDALRPILAADAAPQCIVAIERDDLEGRRAQRVNLAGQHRAERREIGGRIGDMAQLIAERIVPLGDGIQAVDFSRAHQVDGTQAIQAGRHKGLHALLELSIKHGRRRAEANHERRGKRFGGGAQAFDEMADISFQTGEVRRGAFFRARPVFEAHQYGVDSAAVRRQDARVVEQQLEYLIIGRQLDAVIEGQLAHPEGQRRLDGVRGESCADDDGRAGHRIHHLL